MTTTLDIGAFQAKTHLSQLLEKVNLGQSFYITKRGRRLAELRPISLPSKGLRFGSDKGRIQMSEDFEAPIPGMTEYLK